VYACWTLWCCSSSSSASGWADLHINSWLEKYKVHRARHNLECATKRAPGHSKAELEKRKGT
jgi:hypothetical protein